MKKRIILTVLILPLVIYGGLRSQNLFDQANGHYGSGEYQEALDKYLELEKEVVNWKLFFNIGNSYFKLGDPLKARIYYLKAEKLRPFDPSLRNNLEVVEGSLNTGIRPEETDPVSLFLRRVGMIVSIDALSMLILLFMSVLSFFVFKLVINGRSKKYLYGAVTAALFLFLLYFYHGKRVSALYDDRTGVVITNGSKLRSGPGDDNTVLFQVGKGVIVRIIDRNREWVQVKASPEIAGWINGEDIERIRIK